MKNNNSNCGNLHIKIYSIESEEDQAEHFLSQASKPNRSRERSRAYKCITKRSKRNPTNQFIQISSDEDETFAQIQQPHEKKISFNQKKNKFRQSHYPFKKGEVLNKKYEVINFLAEGTFGRVIQASYDHRIFAIKILRPHQKSIQNGQEQKNVLSFLNQKDQKDEHGIVKLIETFTIGRYYCLVFELLGKSLYEVIKINRMQGFGISLVQSFFKQILNSIQFLHSNGYTHTDLKPENIVLVDKKLELSLNDPLQLEGELIVRPLDSKIKIIDFGNAVEDDGLSNYTINTRQYRSPEVILDSCNWNKSNDIWAIGCIIVELLCGRLLFSVKEDQQHLRQIQSFCGRFPKWMYNRSSKYNHLFGSDGLLVVPFGVVRNVKSKRIERIEMELQSYRQLKDLVHKCLQIDPHRRISCDEALQHEFFSLEY